MRLEKASAKAIKYACMTFHYAKAVPVNTFGFSVFNDVNEWCGVVLYGTGASINISKPYNLSQGQVVELVRMALNGKHGITTAVLSLSLRLLRKSVPNVKLVISYADSEQGHNGTIYQASNWFYTGSITDSCFLIDGKMTHRRSAYSKYGTSSLDKIKANNKQVVRVNSKPKYKYIYPLDKTLVPLCKSLAKPYPKSNAAIVQGSISGFQSEDGSRTDLAAQTGNNGIQH
jgi:hypothetical protein